MMLLSRDLKAIKKLVIEELLLKVSSIANTNSFIFPGESENDCMYI